MERRTEEGCVRREDGKVGMEFLYVALVSRYPGEGWRDKLEPYVEKMELIRRATDRIREEEHIALQPRDLGRRILETDAGAAHRSGYGETITGGPREFTARGTRRTAGC